MADDKIVRLYPTDAETSSIHKWAATAMDVQGITALKGMSKADVALVALRGFELGIGMGHALDSIYVVNGRTSMSAELMRERAIGAGYHILVEAEDAEQCTVVIYHTQEPDVKHTETFTMDDARTAGLIKGGGAWTKWPRQMLRARATTNAVRWFAPQALAGCMERQEAYDTPEDLSEPRVLTAEEIQDAEQTARDMMEKHTTLDIDTVDEINGKITRIIVDAELDGAAKKKLAKAYADWKLETFGVKDMGQIPVAREDEVRRWVRRLGERLGVREATGAAQGEEESEESPTPAETVEGPEEAPTPAADAIMDADFEDEPAEELVPPVEPEAEPEAEEEQDTSTGYNTERWSESKVPAVEFGRYLKARYDLDDYPALFEAAGVNKDRLGKLDAAERFQVFQYILEQTPEQGDLFAGE